MNWLQKLSQNRRHPDWLEESIMDIGHGYKRNGNRMDEISQRPEDVLLWYWGDNKVNTFIRKRSGTTHDTEMQEVAYGRIDLSQNIGSIAFNEKTIPYPLIRKNIIENLVQQFPQIKFKVFSYKQILPLQNYWEHHFANSETYLQK